jgi:uncharacterized protein involved in oxidation of intracellular sulfur
VKVLIVINDAPYGTENVYDALRLAMALQAEQRKVDVRIFLLADSVTCALPNQSTPQGYYNTERMLKSIINKGGQVKACGSCCEARGIKALKLIKGVEISTMNQLKDWVLESDKVLTF